MLVGTAIAMGVKFSCRLNDATSSFQSSFPTSSVGTPAFFRQSTKAGRLSNGDASESPRPTHIRMAASAAGSERMVTVKDGPWSDAYARVWSRTERGIAPRLI